MKMTANKKDARKKTILASALKCFLQFGYAKTSIEDVAREASLSRPLIYLNFKNKEDLYIGVIEYLTEGRFEKTEKILKSKQSSGEKLIQIFEIVLLEPWEQIIGKPMSADFYLTCQTIFQELSQKYKCQTLKCLQKVLPDKKTAEIFLLAVEGLKSDLPVPDVLRYRLRILIDKFV